MISAASLEVHGLCLGLLELLLSLQPVFPVARRTLALSAVSTHPRRLQEKRKGLVLIPGGRPARPE